MAQRQTPLGVGGRRDDDDHKLLAKHAAVPAEHSRLIQSRETGDVIPEDVVPGQGQIEALPFAQSWNHFLAGG